jgi:CIC family chloride channel protein
MSNYLVVAVTSVQLVRKSLRSLGRLRRLWRLYLLRFAIRLAPTEAQRLFLLTVAIGALCGLAAVAFHLAIARLEGLLIEPALRAGGSSWIAWTLATPALGGLACGILLHFVVPNARGSGIPQVKVAFASTPAVVPMRDSVGKFAVGALQIGSGASLGREGPTVQICAGVASALGRIARVSETSQRRLIPVGVAAGIAAAFNAPIAAVTFTIEEIVGALDQSVLSGVIVAAALAAVIERSILGESAVFDVPATYGLRHASSLLLYAIIGLAAAAVSVVFTELLLGLRARTRNLTALPRWMHPALGGLSTGGLAVVAMAWLGSTGITGGGYATLGRALNGELAWKVLLALSLLKVLATVGSYSTGGAGGIFAPCLFIGGTLGGAIGALDATWLGHDHEPAGAFALVGMGAVFAGVIRAPITSVLIIVELTHAYSLILPLMIANMTAYVIAKRFRAASIYEALLEQDGIRLQARSRDPRFDAPVGALATFEGVMTLTTGMPAAEVLARCATGNAHTYPVVDSTRRVLGIVTDEELGILRAAPELMPVATASDLMRPPVTICDEDTVVLAMERMLAHALKSLPVVDRTGRLVGLVDDVAILAAPARPLEPRPRNGRRSFGVA